MHLFTDKIKKNTFLVVILAEYTRQVMMKEMGVEEMGVEMGME